MEKLPPVNEKRLFPYTLSIYPFLLEHRIPSGAILPAVHSMQLLVDFIHRLTPDFDTSTLINASFGKLLHLPDNQKNIETWIELTTLSETQLRLALLTKSKSKSGIVRSFPHAGFELCKDFKAHGKPAASEKNKDLEKQNASIGVIPGLTRNLNGRHKNVDQAIPVNEIYPGLVCFDEGFQNVIEPVTTSEFGAVTRVSGGKPIPGPAILGSPFPLDAAFQAACAWGRRYTQQICYPVAFDKRTVLQPTQASELYDTEIRLINQEGGTLEFELSLKNSQGQVMELVKGLKMREIGIGAD